MTMAERAESTQKAEVWRLEGGGGGGVGGGGGGFGGGGGGSGVGGEGGLRVPEARAGVRLRDRAIRVHAPAGERDRALPRRDGEGAAAGRPLLRDDLREPPGE